MVLRLELNGGDPLATGRGTGQVPTPRLVPDLSPALEIAAGFNRQGWERRYTCALLRTGKIRCRGEGAPGKEEAADLFL